MNRLRSQLRIRLKRRLFESERDQERCVSYILLQTKSFQVVEHWAFIVYSMHVVEERNRVFQGIFKFIQSYDSLRASSHDPIWPAGAVSVTEMKLVSVHIVSYAAVLCVVTQRSRCVTTQRTRLACNEF